MAIVDQQGEKHQESQRVLQLLEKPIKHHTPEGPNLPKILNQQLSIRFNSKYRREMPQMVLPVFPEGTTMISPVLGFEKRDGQFYYFHGGIPIFSHAEDDIKSFRMFFSQLVVNGNCKQADVVRAFGIPSNNHG